MLKFADEKRLLVAAGRNLWHWNVDSQTALHKLEGHEGVVQALGVSWDGKKAMSGGSPEDWTIRVWDLEAGKEAQILRLPKFFTVPADAPKIPRAVAFAPDGQHVVVSGYFDPKGFKGGFPMRVWHLDQFALGKEVRTLASRRPPTSLIFAPDGKRMLALGAVPTLWDPLAGLEVRSFVGPCSAAGFRSDPTGRQVVTAGYNVHVFFRRKHERCSPR